MIAGSSDANHQGKLYLTTLLRIRRQLGSFVMSLSSKIDNFMS